MFRIGLFAKLNNVSVKTLRYYDEKGLLKPASIDSQTGYRYYSPDQMLVLNKILSLKSLDFSLTEIAYILEDDMDLDQLLTLKIVECESRIAEDKARLLKMKNLKEKMKEAYQMTYNILIKKSDAVKVATLRREIPTYSAQGPLWEELSAYIEAQGAKIAEPCMVIYHSADEETGAVDAEVVEAIIGNVEATKEIEVKTLPADESLASTIHKGSYEHLYLAYKELYEWIEDNGYKAIGPSRELFLKGEWNASDVKDYITEVQVPVEKLK